jgi:hypothetical protein
MELLCRIHPGPQVESAQFLWLANGSFASHKNDNVTSLRSSVLQVAAQRESLSVTVIDANGVSVFANEIVPVEASAYFPQVRDITKPTFGSENPGDPLHWMPARVAWNTEMGTPGGGATLSFDSPNTCRHAWRNTLGLRRCRLRELGRGYRRHRARQRRRLVRRDRVKAARRTRPPCTPRQAFQLRFRCRLDRTIRWNGCYSTIAKCWMRRPAVPA